MSKLICYMPNYISIKKTQKTKQKSRTVIKNIKVQAFPFISKKEKQQEIPPILFSKKQLKKPYR